MDAELLQEISGKLEIAITALQSGVMTENAQHGLESILQDVQAGVERVGALVSEASGQH